MKFFLDTANLREINEAKSMGFLDGITTNPTLISKENLFHKEEIENHYISICKIIGNNKSVSAEVISTKYEDILKEGMKLSSLHKNIVVKIPATRDGIKSINFFHERGVSTNCTLVFSIGQSILAAKAGATYISPFLGRLDDISYNGIKLIQEIKYIYDEYNFHTKIIAASIRNSIHILECSKSRIFAITSPINIYYSLLNHPLTNKGLKKFIEDYKKKINLT
ncbi:transaldolase family protein [Blattabacterium cuenoti]|uniref:transaldolase family protein n=1 Tax=Blattabacterium cuenoti TaxID=1653831 RepID=UPI00163B7722|nr:transaldolase family protein [Blattabacterium cuenoti]